MSDVTFSASSALRPRDERANLSESSPGTHQHRVPADATCCQSLPLGGHATMTLDLHEWLFLLLTGSEELTQSFPYHGCALPTELGGVSDSLVAGLSVSLQRVWGCSSGTVS